MSIERLQLNNEEKKPVTSTHETPFSNEKIIGHGHEHDKNIVEGVIEDDNDELELSRIRKDLDIVDGEVIESEDIINTGLSSPAELKKLLANVNDLKIILQNRETRLEAISEINHLLSRAHGNNNAVHIHAYEEMLDEQNEALSIISNREAEIRNSGTTVTKQKKSWFSRIFG